MEITRVRIQNFRCFKELDLDLTRCHALVGENGAGKTAVLEAIQLATSSSIPNLHEQDFNNADLGDLVIEVTFSDPFLVRVPDGYTTQDIPCRGMHLNAHRREKAAAGKALSSPFVTQKHAIPLEYEEGRTPQVETGGAAVNIPRSVTKTSDGYEAPRKGSSIFKFTANRLILQGDNTIHFPNIFYFNRDREDQTKVSYNSSFQRVVRDLNWRFRKAWDQEDVARKWDDFYQSVISTVETPKSDRIIGPIREKMQKIAGVDFSDLELGLLEIEQPFSRAFFSRRDGTNQIEQRRFGSGVSILLSYFLLDTVSKLSKEEIIFLIDEPEIHLHPQLQQSLYQEFQNSTHQTIYTTQTDCFISIAEWRSVTRFQTDFDTYPRAGRLNEELEGRPISEHLDEIKKWYQHRSIFFKQDNQIFFARKCLLVEGPAEVYGIPILAQTLGKELGGATIISCNGKSKIPYYQLLCKAFGIPFFTLFDLDGDPADDSENQRPGGWAEAGSLATFSTSFEKLLGVTGDEHKISKLLIKIDGLNRAAIPREITDVISTISNWTVAIH